MLYDTIPARRRGPHFVRGEWHHGRSAAQIEVSGMKQWYSHTPVPRHQERDVSGRDASGLPAERQHERERALKGLVGQRPQRQPFSCSEPQFSIAL